MELNRNYALILGLAIFCFLVELPGDYGTIRDYGDPDYSIVACELVAFMNQFVWLVVFAWTSKHTDISPNFKVPQSQYGNFGIFLLLRFYVKSTLENLEVLKLPLLPF